MIYLGGVFCYIKIRNYLKCREIYATVLIKMVLLPIAFYTIMHYIPSIDRSIAVTLSVLCALPLHGLHRHDRRDPSTPTATTLQA